MYFSSFVLFVCFVVILFFLFRLFWITAHPRYVVAYIASSFVIFVPFVVVLSVSCAARELKFIAENSPLTAGLLNGEFHTSDGGREILPHLPFDLSGDVFSQ
jgi:hypothetical protein